jgi:hypothetical protein
MRHSLNLFAASAVVLAVCSQSAAQTTPNAWFGVPPPAGLGDPHRPILDVTKLTPSAAVVPSGEGGFTELTGAAIRKDLESIVAISRADRARGEKAWGRITGFRGAVDTHAWVLEQFKAAGLTNAETQTYTATQPTWHPKAWGVRVMSAGQEVWLESAFPTSGSQLSATLLAPVVFVGKTSDPALPDVDVKGRIAVQTLHPQAGAFSERTQTTERARELAKRGAVAVLNVIEQAGNMYVRDFSNCGVPCFNVGSDDGRFLTTVLERAKAAGVAVQARIDLQTEMLDALKGHNTIGMVRGRRDGEMMIVNAHADGWFDAAGDNGDGLAVLIALARHFAKPANQPERTLLFVASGGHHGAGMNGPGNLVTMNPQLKGKVVLVLNLEHIAQYEFRNDPFRISANEQPMGFGISNEAPAIADVARQGMQRYGFALRPNFSNSIAGDLGGYAPLDAPRVQAIHAGPMYHTSGDTLDTISTPGLERAARFYAYFVTEIAKTDAAKLRAGK